MALSPPSSLLHSTRPTMATESVSRGPVHRRIDLVCTRLRRRHLVGSHATALEVIRLIREVVSSARFARFEQLCEHLSEIGGKLEAAGPKEPVIGNVVRRVLKFLREEYSNALQAHLLPHLSSPASLAQTPGSETPSRTPHSSFPAPGDSSSASSFFDLLGHRPSHAFGVGAGAETALGADTPLLFGTPASSRSGTPPPSSSVAVLPPHRRSSFGFPRAGLPTLTEGRKTREVLEAEFSAKSAGLKPIFIEAIQELFEEVEMVAESVASQAGEHVHSSEIIMTMDHSRTVEAFVRSAGRKRKFTVIVAETAPSFTGRLLSSSLSSPASSSSTAPPPSSSEPAVPTLLIPDSSVFALVPRCSKIVIGCHAVLADGSILARAGSLAMCMAAKAHLVPVVVVCGLYKFSPRYSLVAPASGGGGGRGGGGGGGKGRKGGRTVAAGDVATWDLKSPDEVLRLDDREGEADIEVLNPYYDRVPPDLISLFISNLGAHPSSLIYRLLTDLYG